MRVRLFALLSAAALLSPGPASGQARPPAPRPEPVPTVTGTLAVRNALIVPAPGRAALRATLVIRDGLITAVGPDAPVPYDARVIDGDSLWAYAGFVDALSHAGVPEPEADRTLPAVDDPDDPPFDRAGIRPDRDVRNLLAMDDATVAGLRDAGFAAAHSVPRGGMLAGKGAVVLLASARRPAILRSDFSQAASFEPARGVAPATPMGVSAKLRQLVRESMRRASVEERYRRDPSGMVPPPWDVVHASIAPVASGDHLLYFHTRSALEAHRALALRDELGLRMVLTGLGEGHALAEKLARSGLPLALTLDLPASPEWAAGLKADSVEAVMASFEPEARFATYRDLEAESRNLRARQLVSRDAYLSNAARMYEAGLRFAFATRDVKPADVRRNLLQIVKAGLDPDAALAALTVNGAELLGLSSTLGTLEAGKLGNVVLFDGPIFEDSTKIRYVVVAGEVYEPARPRRSEGRDGATAGRGAVVTTSPGFEGTWALTAETPEGPVDGRLVVRESPTGVSATLTYGQNPAPIEIRSVRIDGERLTCSFESPDGTVTMTLTRDGDTVSGSADVGSGPLPITGRRVPGEGP